LPEIHALFSAYDQVFFVPNCKQVAIIFVAQTENNEENPLLSQKIAIFEF